jgi:hypothetical protein
VEYAKVIAAVQFLLNVSTQVTVQGEEQDRKANELTDLAINVSQIESEIILKPNTNVNIFNEASQDK